jgi:hypothetical protein
MLKKCGQELFAIVLVIFLAFAVLVLGACQAGQKQSRLYKVGILQFVDVLANVEDGFKAGMTIASAWDLNLIW